MLYMQYIYKILCDQHFISKQIVTTNQTFHKHHLILAHVNCPLR